MRHTPESRPIDLHVHTTASDGDMTPRECVAAAARVGLAAIAITDHDTMAGNDEAAAAGQRLGVEVVPGVEISCSHDRVTVHLLGYYPEPENPRLASVLAELRSRREERNPRIVARLAELGCAVDYREVVAVAGGGVVGRPHIAAVMVRRGYVRSLDEAFDRYLARGAAAYVERVKPTVSGALAALRAARAIPVLAHPGILGAGDFGDVERLVRELAAMGLRGLEAYYNAHDAALTSKLLALAAREGLVVAGGTDFHGSRKPDIALGRGLGNMAVPYEILEGLKRERARL